MGERWTARVANYLRPERTKNKEALAKKAFRIRGQHLEQYAELLKERSKTTNQDTLLDRMICKKVSLMNSLHPRDTRETELKLKKTYARFINLPVDYPVEIVEGIEDEICKGCMGKYDGPCSVQDKNYHKQGFSLDGNGLNSFMHRAHKLRLLNSVSVNYETAEFQDGETARTRIYQLSAGVLKQVLNNW